MARPYRSWERSLNENTNGLVRQCILKKKIPEDVDDAEVKAIADDLNHRPRKCLDYMSPYEALSAEIRIQRGVALQI